jgi:hypothetical protein
MDRIKNKDSLDFSTAKKKGHSNSSTASRQSYWKDFFAHEQRARATENSRETGQEARELIKQEKAREKQTTMKTLLVFVKKDNSNALQAKCKDFPRLFESKEGISLYYEALRCDSVKCWRVIIRANPGITILNNIRDIIAHRQKEEDVHSYCCRE